MKFYWVNPVTGEHTESEDHAYWYTWIAIASGYNNSWAGGYGGIDNTWWGDSEIPYLRLNQRSDNMGISPTPRLQTVLTVNNSSSDQTNTGRVGQRGRWY
jgi:hypothetical protein